MRPHEQPPLTLFADHLPAPDTYSKVADASAHRISTLNVCDLLCEPDPRSGQEWTASVYRRLIAASTGPVAVGVRKSPIRARLESAGWFVAADDANFSEARAHCWPALPKARRQGIGVGSPRPMLVLCGDRVTRHGQLPFTSKNGTWLFLALRALGYDELSVYLTNVRSVRGARQGRQLKELHEAFGDDPKWIALGNTAQEVLRVNKIPHAKVCHPSHHRRFKHHEDVSGYAKRLLDAGVPWGPWHDGQSVTKFYTHPVPSIPILGEPYSVRDMSNRGLPKADTTTGQQAKAVDPVKRETARRAFVMGEATSIKEAAILAGIHVDQARAVAAAEHWKAERDEHQRAVTERVKERAEKALAKDMADSINLAWKATKLGLTDVVERLLAARGESTSLQKLAEKLAAGDAKAVPLHPSPQGTEALARVALNLQGAEIATDPETDRVRSLPLQELAEETLRCMKEQFGA